MSKTKTFISFSRISSEGIERILYRTQITPGRDSVSVGNGEYETPEEHALYLHDLAASNTLYPTEVLDPALLESLQDKFNNLLLQAKNGNTKLNIKATMAPLSIDKDKGALLIDIRDKITSEVEELEQSLIASTIPQNIVPPSISGVSIVGREAIVDLGSWSGFPTPTLSLQWKKNGIDLPGSQSRTWAAEDYGELFTVVVTATNSQGFTEATSLEIGPVTSGEITFNDLVLTFDDLPITMEN